MLCSQNFPKQTKIFFQRGVRAPGVPVPDPPLEIHVYLLWMTQFFFSLKNMVLKQKNYTQFKKTRYMCLCGN